MSAPEERNPRHGACLPLSFDVSLHLPLGTLQLSLFNRYKQLSRKVCGILLKQQVKQFEVL